MCGRFVSVSSTQLLVDRFGVQETAVVEREPDYNVTPRATVPVVRVRRPRSAAPDEPGTWALSMLRWGLVPSWAEGPRVGDKLINARAETIAAKPAFQAAFRRRRCIVPADAFYEWKRARAGTSTRRPPRQPFLIHRRDGEPMAFAGLWEIWRDPAVADVDAPDAWLRTCAIVTTAANAVLAPFHDRMPVVLGEDDWHSWLDPTVTDTTLLTSLLRPAPDDWLEAYSVSTRVNTPANNDAGLLQRVEPDTLPDL
jgi:putative SOS response-associated peptidase YedK